MKSLLLTLYDAEMARTAPFLDAVPDAALAWAPDRRSLSMGRLAVHVATLPGWMAAYTTREGYDMSVGGPGPKPPVNASAIRDAFILASARGRQALASCPEAALDEPWTLWRGQVALLRLTRGEAIATFALHHLVHHRGQLGVYLRLCGIAVPATYGDSADTQLGRMP